MKLSYDFYRSENVIMIARQLLGKILCTKIDGIITSGIITETEAYAGLTDKASHAYGGRNTQRTSVMYLPGGISYVYLCYGIHNLFNVVTGPENVPHAVLVRGIYPCKNKQAMLKRLFKKSLNKRTTNGPGKLTKALGITSLQNGLSLRGNVIWIEDEGVRITGKDIVTGPRIGIDYAQEDALLPYRFHINEKATFFKEKVAQFIC